MRATIKQGIKRVKFVNKNMKLCAAAFEHGYSHTDYKSTPGRKLIKKARKKLKYKGTTYAGDIYYLLGRLFKIEKL